MLSCYQNIERTVTNEYWMDGISISKIISPPAVFLTRVVVYQSKYALRKKFWIEKYTLWTVEYWRRLNSMFINLSGLEEHTRWSRYNIAVTTGKITIGKVLPFLLSFWKSPGEIIIQMYQDI